MDLELRGKVALVTGGSRGIGRACALALAAEGARVAVCARGEEGLADVRGALAGAGPGPHLAVAADVTTREGVDRIVAHAAAELGGIDLVVNNVGGSGARSFEGADEDDFRSVFERNFWPALRVSRAALPHLRARRGGAVVMITSIWGREAGGGPSYNAAKAAEMSLAKAMARDLAQDGIRVNSVAPGSILFPGGGWERRQRDQPELIAEMLAKELPFGRFGRPEEVAAVVAFLCSNRSSWISGACIPVDGAQGRAF
jgi:3-oxoacyl-[acyl-carrier protein] reductase